MAKGHHYPAFVFRFPVLIRLVYLWNDVFLRRNAVVRRHLNRHLLQFQPKSIADLGFGEGQHLFRLAARHPAVKAYGLEVDLDHLAFATRYKALFGLGNLMPIQHDLSSCPLPTTVDFIYSVGVLQLVPQDDALVRNAFDSLPAGGHFLLYQPVNGHSYLPGAAHLQQRLHGYDVRQGFSRVYQRTELLALFEQAGFRLIWEEQHMGPWQVLAHEMYVLPISYLLYSKSWLSRLVAGLALLLLMPMSMLLRLFAKAKAAGKYNALCLLFEKPACAKNDV